MEVETEMNRKVPMLFSLKCAAGEMKLLSEVKEVLSPFHSTHQEWISLLFLEHESSYHFVSLLELLVLLVIIIYSGSVQLVGSQTGYSFN
jgi:hypothetical protein